MPPFFESCNQNKDCSVSILIKYNICKIQCICPVFGIHRVVFIRGFACKHQNNKQGGAEQRVWSIFIFKRNHFYSISCLYVRVASRQKHSSELEKRTLSVISCSLTYCCKTQLNFAIFSSEDKKWPNLFSVYCFKSVFIHSNIRFVN